MSEPDRIWATAYYSQNRSEHVREWNLRGYEDRQDVEYIRRDPAVIAALPEVQAIVDAAQAVIDRWDSPLWGGSGEKLRHTGEYITGLRSAIAAIRKRGEG